MWAPDGSALAVERADRSGHRVDVLETGSWRVRFSVTGSRPAWAPDGTALALVDPFAPRLPPSESTTFSIIDARTGAPRTQQTLSVFGLGWRDTQLFGIVDGALRAVSTQSAPVTPVATCADGCATADWFPAGGLVALSGNIAPYPFEIHDVSRSPSRLLSIGAAEALVWAQSAPALAWSLSGSVHIWDASSGERELTSLAGRRPVLWSANAEVLLARDDRTNTWTQWVRASDTTDSVQPPDEISAGGPMFCAPGSGYVAAIVGGTSSVRLYPVVAR